MFLLFSTTQPTRVHTHGILRKISYPRCNINKSNNNKKKNLKNVQRIP